MQTSIARPRPLLLAGLAAALIALIALLVGSAATASAQPQTAAKGAERKAGKSGKPGKRARKARAQRYIRAKQRRKTARGRGKVADNVAVAARAEKARPKAKPKAKAKAAPAPVPASEGFIDAGFEDGLYNWNTAGVGDVIPSVASDIVRSGGFAGDFTLSGDQERSELILGGDGGGSAEHAVFLDEGDEGFYAFSFYIESMVYGEPGGHNLIMQFKGDDDGSPSFGLQLWDYEGDDGEYEDNPKGLWSHSEAMGGDRFLAPVPEQTWHDVMIHFRASGQDDGFYRVYLNGELIDSADGVSIIPPAAEEVYIKTGLYRGDDVYGTSELRVDSAKLGPTAESVLPG